MFILSVAQACAAAAFVSALHKVFSPKSHLKIFFFFFFEEPCWSVYLLAVCRGGRSHGGGAGAGAGVSLPMHDGVVGRLE